MADTTRPLDVRDTRSAAERVAREVWAPGARAHGYEVEVRPVLRGQARVNPETGRYAQAGPYGIFLRERGAASRP